MELKGKRILITGGTSGLGRALALDAKSRGARVAVVARSPLPLHSLATEHDLIAIEGDASNKNDIHRIAGEALARLGGLDVLVNNASALGPTPLKLLLDTECEDFEHVLATNLLGPFRLTKAVLPSLILAGEGAVLNISSDAAVSPYPRWGAYGASKAALAHLSRIWGEELKDSGVKFVAVDPGDMDTPMHAAAVPDADPATLLRPIDVARKLWESL